MGYIYIWEYSKEKKPIENLSLIIQEILYFWKKKLNNMNLPKIFVFLSCVQKLSLLMKKLNVTFLNSIFSNHSRWSQ